MNHRGAQINGVLFFFSLFCAAFLCTCLLYSLFFIKVPKTRYNSRVSKKISYVCYRFFCSNFNRLFDKYSNLKRKNSKHESYRSRFSASFLFMDCLFWITEVGDNDPENRLVRNFRIANRFTSIANNSLIMTFSGKLVNTKVVDIFLSFLESIRR
jgi:hypothetical protein